MGRCSSPRRSRAFISSRLDLKDAKGKLISTNFYWRAAPEHQDDLTDLNNMPVVTLESADRAQGWGRKMPDHRDPANTSSNIALMAHVQLRRKKSGERVLPVFYDGNYVSLVPHEQRTITMEADEGELNGEDALVMVDGWNRTVAASSAKGVAVAPNTDADPGRSPETGLPFQTEGLR